MSVTVQKLKDENWFKISNLASQRPFFMSIVSDSNHWMFISSNGGLTAGRKNSEFALFPYYTDDKLTELAHSTGSKSIFQVKLDGEIHVWEPFSDRDASRYKTNRNLYKNWYGNKILFEEINHTLGLTFSYQWNSSNLYGFVRNVSIHNHSGKKKSIKLLDGIQNILPYGVNPELQVRSSNLLDAYKRNELIADTGLGIYALSAIPVDKAEPSEALKANIAWAMGLENPTYLVSSLQLDKFRNLKTVEQEEDVKAEKGAYFVLKDVELEKGSTKEWSIVANVNQNHAGVIELNRTLKEKDGLEELVKEDIERGTQNLKQLVAGSDGIQHSADTLSNARHYSNTLFNIMRGGTFDHNYTINKQDFVDYLENANRQVFANNQDFISDLPDTFDKSELDTKITATADVDLLRLGKEYLPLKFSRRHGDPSRPWNQFSINTHSENDESKILDYEGNWRDIFQNWEALAHSYPKFIEGMMYKFLNASTFDGYNPYRVTKGGIDWEISDPDDPWSYIGYWGDHQIIYLLKFLEFYQDYEPKALQQLLDKEVFVYANVPYQIKSYQEIAQDPKDTIEFDVAAHEFINKKIKEVGADGALRNTQGGEVHHVNFLEKVLATVLSKVSNFIPEGGIWMNTQRPEWNDANNALVGNGVSMVTLCYLRRFLKFFEPIIAENEGDDVIVSTELHGLFQSIHKVLTGYSDALHGAIDDRTRELITEKLGNAGSEFRDQVYDHQFEGSKKALSYSQISEFIQVTLQYLEHSIDANKREDDLYHAYNIMSLREDGISISYLDEMLEGQVAVLSSGYLTEEEALKLLDALRNSSLYREDQMSYILYPNKELPKFLKKNNIPEELVQRSKLLQKLIEDHHRGVVNKDVDGGYHFNGNFTNARDLKKALHKLEDTKYSELVKQEKQPILDIFEEVFNHKAFTGRSGTFFAYEGLGSIYWHMVSKLYLAVFEVCASAYQKGIEGTIQKQLAKHFDEIAAGIGVHKSPELYGAFPTDPYSHTPAHRGAQQPGMTGQVKEDILVRIGELGVTTQNGKLQFDPFLLKESEFTSREESVEMIALDQTKNQIQVPAGALLFSCCQVPVIYQAGSNQQVQVLFSDGTTKEIEGTKLNEELSQHIFIRTGKVEQINVQLSTEQLR